MNTNDWLSVLSTVSIVGLYACQIWQERLHKKEIARIHQSYQEERQELLDRIMSNNIHEFKHLTGQNPVTRSNSGNYLVDRMEKSLKKQYPDIE